MSDAGRALRTRRAGMMVRRILSTLAFCAAVIVLGAIVVDTSRSTVETVDAPDPAGRAGDAGTDVPDQPESISPDPLEAAPVVVVRVEESARRDGQTTTSESASDSTATTTDTTAPDRQGSEPTAATTAVTAAASPKTAVRPTMKAPTVKAATSSSSPPSSAATASRRSSVSASSQASPTTRPTTTTRRASTTATRPTTVTTASPATPAGGRVVWEEHFDRFDPERWAREYSTYGDGNGERQCYRPENVDVANGRLRLTARSETHTCPGGRQRSVTSGMIRSRGLRFSPGQAIEFRVKLTVPDPTNQGGLWPAVWASSWAPGGWPRGGELDWLEVMTAEDPRRAVFSLHYADSSGRHELQNKAVPLSGYFSDSWHTVRFDYGHRGHLTWYLDGRQVFSVDGADTLQGYPSPFDQSIGEIKINLAVGGTPGPLAGNALGSTGAVFEVDYIRVVNL